MGFFSKKTHGFLVHPGRLTWNIIIEVWKIIFLSKWVICMFHINLPGCMFPPEVLIKCMDTLIYAEKMYILYNYTLYVVINVTDFPLLCSFAGVNSFSFPLQHGRG